MDRPLPRVPWIVRSPAFDVAALIVLAVAAWTIPSVGAEADVPPTPTIGRDEIASGESVVVRWSAIDDVEEMELMLSVDGGRSFPLRVSPELEGRDRRYVWRVPHVGARDARLRLRARIRGREVDGPPSASFAITLDPTRPAHPWFFTTSAGWTVPQPRSLDRCGLAPPAPHWCEGGRCGPLARASERLSIGSLSASLPPAAFTSHEPSLRVTPTHAIASRRYSPLRL